LYIALIYRNSPCQADLQAWRCGYDSTGWQSIGAFS